MKLTKWDYLTYEQRAGLLATPLSNCVCSKCGLVLATEADFAMHFIVTDPRYLNLGECPRTIIEWLMSETSQTTLWHEFCKERGWATP